MAGFPLVLFGVDKIDDGLLVEEEMGGGDIKEGYKEYKFHDNKCVEFIIRRIFVFSNLAKNIIWKMNNIFLFSYDEEPQLEDKPDSPPQKEIDSPFIFREDDEHKNQRPENQ